jgi:DNA-binding NarL/FixJ family response regulator
MTPSRALVVEDLGDAREWIAATLRAVFPAVEIACAATLAEARAVLARQDVDLALVDLGLPDGSGTELIREVAASGKNTVTVVTTIFGDDEHLFAALRAGAQGYVLKDDSKETLGALLEEIVSGRPPLSPAIARRLLSHFREQQPASEVTLTERERDVLTLLAKGYTVARVADLLDITRNTAAGYAKSVYRKLNVSSRAEATLEATRRGLVRP